MMQSKGLTEWTFHLVCKCHPHAAVRAQMSPLYIWPLDIFVRQARMDVLVMLKVAEYGNLEALQVLLQELNTVRQSEDWKRCCCAFAARGGHVNVLEWLRSFDSSYAFDWVVCLFAAQHGHLDTLKWLRAQSPPCPWRPVEVLKFAQQFQRTRVVDWVTQQTTLAMHSHGVEASGGLPLMQNEH